MAIKIYNSLTKRKELFEPIAEGIVGMYVCGVTVYDVCHIGHIRNAFVFNVIKNYFEYTGYKVNYVRNITDVDDKIIERAKREFNGAACADVQFKNKVKEIAERFTKRYYEDMSSLGIDIATVEPLATEHISEMLNMIRKLEENGIAYRTDNGVYFDVGKFRQYGKLSNRTGEEMMSGARVEIDESKKNPLDFP